MLPRKPELILIASSTAGPVALRKLLGELPASFPVPILLVQHILKDISSHFAAQLAAQCKLRVVLAQAGLAVEAGVVILAPGDQHMALCADGKRWSVRLHQGPKENSVRPAADVLFRSAAELVGPGALGLVLTGMGKDGLEGCRAILAAGGQVWAQDKTSAVVTGMPGSVIDAGLSQYSAPPEELGRALARLALGFVGPQMAREAASAPEPALPRPRLRSSLDEPPKLACSLVPAKCSAQSFQFMRQLMHEHAGIALAENKDYFVATRLAALADEVGIPGVDALVDKLRQLAFGELHASAIEALTVNETSFFRDAPIFDILLKRVLPELVERRKGERTFQVWSAACSTGEEPYSLAMLMRARFPELGQWKFSVLATDISQRVLAKAREGLYTQREIGRGLPKDMLHRFFVQEGCSWRAGRELRGMIDFRELNLRKPIPYQRTFDLILMRNVLIYFDDETKRDVLMRIAQALRPQGVLVLGNADALREPGPELEAMHCEPLVAYVRRA
jgi:chemotaxis protein methyltransferase CheR